MLRQNSIQRLVLMFVLLGSCTVSAIESDSLPTVSNEPKEIPLFNEACLLYKAGNTIAALEKFRAFNVLNGSHVDGLVAEGKTLLLLGKYDLADQVFSKILDANPKHLQARLGKIFVISMKGDTVSSLQQLQELAKLNPGQADIYYQTGVTYFLAENYPKAIVTLDSAIVINPLHLTAYHDRAAAKQNIKDWAGAIADYRKVLELDSTNYQALINLALTHKKTGDTKMAADLFTKAIKLFPAQSEAWNNRGLIYLESEQHDLALRDFKQATKVNPQNFAAFNNIACVQFAKKDYNACIDACSQAIKINPSLGAAFLNRGIAKEILLDLPGACEDWMKAKKLGVDLAAEYLNECSKQDIGE